MGIVIIRGGGDIATGIAYRLFKSGFNIIITDIEKPTAIRRKVSFCEAIYEGQAEVEGVEAIYCRDKNDIATIKKILQEGKIAVLVDEDCSITYKLEALAVVDSILAKTNLGTKRDMAEIVIGVGPGFSAGRDTDLVVETNRGHNLGRIIEEGKAAENTGIPGNIIGFTSERIIRAQDKGIIKNYYKIGDMVKKGDIICTTGEADVRANIDGVIRGLLKEGLFVKKGMKIGDIDPRGILEYTYTISDKARAVGGGVLEAIMRLRRKD
nr:selenium-dependent molybdenum cofactor biosynthesis protein YqeB [Tissierella sp.]